MKTEQRFLSVEHKQNKWILKSDPRSNLKKNN